MIPLLAALALQVTPVAPIVKGTALPPEAGEEAAVLAPVRALLAGIGAGDPTAALAGVRQDGTLTVALERADGSRALRRMSWSDFAAALRRPHPGRVEERLLDPAVEIDGDVAMVWSPYVFLVDGRADHCGANHFDLVRESGTWRLLNVTWSQRSTGCTVR